MGKRRVDFLVEGKIILESKSSHPNGGCASGPGLNYLEAYNLEIGLLINFAARGLQFKRLLNKNFKENDCKDRPVYKSLRSENPKIPIQKIVNFLPFY